LKSLVEKEQDIKIIAEADNGRDAIILARKFLPDVIVMDVTMPMMNGIDATSEIVQEFPSIKVLALSMHSDKQYVIKILEAGASGFLLKNCAAQDLVFAIRALAANRTYLSQEVMDVIVKDYPGRNTKSLSKKMVIESVENQKLSTRERETLQLLAEGKISKEIAEILHVSVKSVEVYRKALYDKLGVGNLADLIKYAIREGITEL
jgi:DNA-binding NarL/FixJ family response regulator